jgi:cysteine synthase
MVIKVKELADKHGWFFPNQFDNEANAWIHEQTTGPEIIDAFAAHSTKIDHFVIAYGTGESSLGMGRGRPILFQNSSPRSGKKSSMMKSCSLVDVMP